jgi:adenine-specific DNA-methyltransferase
MAKENTQVKVGKAKGRPMLTWVGKKPLTRVTAYPAQAVESFTAETPDDATADLDWTDWPEHFPRGGLLFHGDNKDVLAHLLANGFRGKVKLIYIDPPFDSGADYVRKVQLRGKGGSTKIEGEEYTLGEQVQYTDIWANDNYLQFMYERLLLLKELLREDGCIYLHCDSKRNYLLRTLLDEVFGADNFQSEIIWKRTSAHSDSSTFGLIHDSILFYGKSKNYTWNPQYTKYEDWYVERYYRYKDEDGRRFKSGDLSAYGLSGGGYEYEWKGREGKGSGVARSRPCRN